MMKKLTLFIVSMIFSICVYSQIEEYPKFYVVNDDTVGIIISIDQAQKIDNDLEIKNLLESALINCDSLSNQYIVVVSKLEKIITVLEIKSSELLLASNTQNQIIGELKKKISNYEKDLSFCEEQSKKKDTIISNQKRTINRLKYGGGSTSVILLILLAISIL